MALPVTRDAGSRRSYVPSYLQCWICLWTVKIALRVAGFDRTMTWLRRRTEGVRTLVSVDTGVVRAAEHRVAMAAAFYPGRARCLEQSLVLYYVMRRQGIPVTYCQGVRLYPFAAHAWIEYENEVVNDLPEHILPFTRLPDPSV